MSARLFLSWLFVADVRLGLLRGGRDMRPEDLDRRVFGEMQHFTSSWAHP